MSYFGFIRTELRFLLFGLILMLFSNLGQTYYIGLYASSIRSTFELTHSQFGAFYSAVTLLSALVLFWSGPVIDRVRLASYATAVVAGLGLSCLLLGFAGHWLLLAAAMFGTRHLGQGLCTHTAITALARAYGSHRARAISVAQLGYASGEAFLPLATVGLTALLGWQGGWLLLGAVVLLLGVPLLRHLAASEPDWRAEQAAADPAAQANRAAVLRDRRFYLLLPLFTAAPFLLTGMFFNQVALGDEMGWTLEQIAAGFLFYALCKVVVALITGALVDRFSALRLFPLAAVLLALAFAVIALPDALPAEVTLWAWLGFCGVAIGFVVPASGALWPELFGTAHLGAIRSLTSPIVIFSTALAPALFAVAIDWQLSFATVAQLCLGYLVVAAVLARLAGVRALAAPSAGRPIGIE